MSTEALLVNSWQGIDRGLRSGQRSTRRTLDAPRELRNVLVDERGHLHVPPAHTDTLHTFATGTAVRQFVNFAGTTLRTGILVQVDATVYALRTNASGVATNPPVQVATMANDTPVWTCGYHDALYFGNETETFKLTYDSGTDSHIAVSVTTAGMPHGFHSATYFGRRFVLKRNDEVWFSDLNAPETFGVDSVFTIGGDSWGGSWSEDPGSVVALREFENTLVVFCTQSVWIITGTGPETFQFRRTNAIAGCWARDSVVRTDIGILYFGGTPRGEFGVYLFTGNHSELVSQPVSAFFREWEKNQGGLTNLFTYATQNLHAVRWNDTYLLAAPGVDADRQVYAYDLHLRGWTTFGGYAAAPRLGLARDGLTPDSLYVSDGLALRRTPEPIYRPAAEGGRLTLGWDDDGFTGGHTRFLALKLAAWASSGTVTITVTARTPDSSDVTTVRTLGADAYDTLVFPLRLRGNAIELDIEVAPAGGARVLIEAAQLVISKKGEKVSRQ